MKTWIITDTHFYHANMVHLCGRPPDFNKRIQESVCRLVAPEDRIVHLGDITLGADARAHEDFIQHWPGVRVLVRGNHDRKSCSWYMDHGWHWVCEALVLQRMSRRVLLTHKPSASLYDCDVNIHGHFHNKDYRGLIDGVPPSPQHILLSLEWSNYQPQLLDTLLEGRVPRGENYEIH